jgi:hypothetical protein
MGVRYLATAVAGIVGGVVGWVGIAAAVMALAAAAGMHDRDGGLAMSAFFFVGPFGGIAGLVTAVWLMLRRRKETAAAPLGRHTLVALGAVVMIAAAVAAGFWLNRPYVTTSGLPPELRFELRLPRDAKPPALVTRSEALARRSPIELVTSQNTMSAEIERVRMEDGHPVLVGRVEMHYRTRDRAIVFKLPAGEVAFDVKLAASPDATADFGAWAPPSKRSTTAAGEGYALRYRVETDGR